MRPFVFDTQVGFSPIEASVGRYSFDNNVGCIANAALNSAVNFDFDFGFGWSPC